MKENVEPNLGIRGFGVGLHTVGSNLAMGETSLL